MTPLEKMARAINDMISDTPYDHLPERASYMERKTHGDRAILDRSEAMTLARAALQAIREPDEATSQVGGDVLLNKQCPPWDASDVFTAMIENILERG